MQILNVSSLTYLFRLDFATMPAKYVLKQKKRALTCKLIWVKCGSCGGSNDDNSDRDNWIGSKYSGQNKLLISLIVDSENPPLCLLAPFQINSHLRSSAVF